MSTLKDLSGKTVTVSNGHLSYEILDAKSEFVPVLGELLQNQFGYLPVGSPAIGLSEVVAEIELNGTKLGLGWDNWSGAYVMAYCESGDSLIKTIASYLSDELEQPKYRKYASM
ncbi:hypothetical protein BTJ40_09355 [Microbulbifer sp. A4B17]|uniref:hypothetical protein n=1 Tax=Microbulbifer sp. A4B17 TaxID=359370 RepID=UPI000D52CC44|nr:hypothetical protein [Microbulbifer sp. A4B17]AWF81002.1 hypothetical protein BTJ40_09355 [Microbulbifer sp. A4B17]